MRSRKYIFFSITAFGIVAVGTLLFLSQGKNAWQKYKDPSFGYQFQVPKSWSKSPIAPTKGYVNFYSREGLHAPLELLADDLSLTVRIRNVGSNVTVETFASRTERNLDGNPNGTKNIIVEQTDKILQGQPVIIQREEVPPDADSESGYMKVLYLLHNGALYTLTVLGSNEEVIIENEDLIDQIFERFSF